MNNIKYIIKEQIKIHRLVSKETDDYYLTGGTALAFHYKHRFSEDLDYFSQNYKVKSSEKIMQYISKKTRYDYTLVFEQNKKKLLPLRMYELVLDRNLKLKIDFVHDPFKNIKKIENGMHSVEDIYYRNIYIGLNPSHVSTNDVGKEVSTSRQVAKDLYDLYYLSNSYELLSKFYLNHFSQKYITRLGSWYRSINRLDMKIELSETIAEASPEEVLKHLDEQLIHGLLRQ